MKWDRVNCGAMVWRSSCGKLIQRMWSLTGNGASYHLCFLTQDDFDKGINISTRVTLKEAKDFFKTEAPLI